MRPRCLPESLSWRTSGCLLFCKVLARKYTFLILSPLHNACKWPISGKYLDFVFKTYLYLFLQHLFALVQWNSRTWASWLFQPQTRLFYSQRLIEVYVASRSCSVFSGVKGWKRWHLFSVYYLTQSRVDVNSGPLAMAIKNLYVSHHAKRLVGGPKWSLIFKKKTLYGW